MIYLLALLFLGHRIYVHHGNFCKISAVSILLSDLSYDLIVLSIMKTVFNMSVFDICGR